MATPKRTNEFLQERVVLSFDHPSVTATTAWKFFKVPAGRTLKIDAVEYLNPTGLAEDASNNFALAVKADAVVVGSLNTDSDLDPDIGASIAANTFTTMTPGTAAESVAAAGAELSLTATETGTATLPAGRVIVHARYIQ